MADEEKCRLMNKTPQPWFTKGRRALACLLLVIMLERLGFYTIVLNASTFSSSHLQFGQTLATTTSILFTGSVFLCAPLFGWIADRMVGYFPSLVTAFIFYTLGSIPICYAAVQAEEDGSQLHHAQESYIVGLFLVALGASTGRATLVPYMLEQLGDGNERHEVIAGLVSISYFTINLGGGAACLAGAFLWKHHGIEDKSQYNGYFWCYLLAALSFFLSFLLLISCKKQMRTHKLEGSTGYTPRLRDILATGCGCYRSSGPHHYDRRRLPVKSEEEEIRDHQDEHRQRLGVLVPVLSSLIIFFAVQGQIYNVFMDQVRRLDLSYDKLRHTFNMNDSLRSDYCLNETEARESIFSPFLTETADVAAVLLAIPIMWYIAMPLYAKLRGRLMTMLDRILLGMICAMLACLAIIGVEVARLQHEIRHVCLKDGPVPQLQIYSHLSPLVQIPQCALTGLSEVFAIIAAEEFVLSRAPREFRCTAYGVLVLVLGLGEYVRLILVSIMNKLHCYYQDVEQSVKISILIQKEKDTKAWVFFLVLTLLLAVNIAIFCWIKYIHKDVLREQRTRINQRTVN